MDKKTLMRMIVSVAALTVMWRGKLMFPSIPALAVIPFILPDTYLLFPLEVALGGAYVIITPLVAGSLRMKRAV